jgi:AGZA family xanthine/uracil permease-like MFS transporter
MFEKLFRLTENKTNVRQEIIGGITTFMTMSYIIFVQPAVLSICGMDKGAVTSATCLASGIATLLMAFLANYPIAQAPAMGHNFYFVYAVCLGMGVSWQIALGANFISGFIFILLSFVGLREKLVNSVPTSLKNSIAVGIGLLIALIGLEWSGIVAKASGTLIGLGNLKSTHVLLSLCGILLTSIFLCLRIKGAILLGIVLNTIFALILGMTQFSGIMAKPPSLAPTFLKLDILGALQWNMLGVIFTLLFLDLFDSIGTLIGIAEEGGFLRNGKLPRAKGALLSDAIGTVEGTLLGTSTVSSYIESASGVAEGARTGLANIITSLLFILSIFFYPLIKMVSAGVAVNEATFYPTIAPALIIVGVLMMNNVKKIEWSDYSEAIPAFLTIVIMAFSFSITDGIAFGFISYALLKTIQRKYKEVPLLIYIFAFLLILRYIFLR